MKYSVFDAFYDLNRKDWGGNSGPGSDPLATQPYRNFLELFIHSNRIRSIVDFGCGDWRFSRFVDFGAVEYLGVDVVNDVIEGNRNRYSTDRISFAHFDGASYGDLPAADLLIMKDVLQHLPDDVIIDVRDNLIPRYPFSLITNSFAKIGAEKNVDICIGEFRCLDLTLAPYSFKGAYVSQYYSPVYEVIKTLLILNGQ